MNLLTFTECGYIVLRTSDQILTGCMSASSVAVSRCIQETEAYFLSVDVLALPACRT